MKTEYVFPFITWQQYYKLLEQDRNLKIKNPEKCRMLHEEAEHRFLYGCPVCGWKGIYTKHKKEK